MAKAESLTVNLSLHLREEAKSLRNAVQPYVVDLKRSAIKDVRIPTKTGSGNRSQATRKVYTVGD